MGYQLVRWGCMALMAIVLIVAIHEGWKMGMAKGGYNNSFPRSATLFMACGSIVLVVLIALVATRSSGMYSLACAGGLLTTYLAYFFGCWQGSRWWVK